MIIAASVAVVVIVLLYVLLIRQSDLPYVEPLSPVAHLDERKAAIFENIRDANFEFLMGKLSPDDYQQTKNDLQKELADVNVEIESVLTRAGSTEARQATEKRKLEGKPTATPQVAAVASVAAIVCPHCNATFATPMRFCGECGKPMEGKAE
jgi:hypothetical protein